MSSFESEVAQALKAVVESPQGQTELTTLVTEGETLLTGLVQTEIKNLPSPGGLAGMAVKALETSVANQLVQKFKQDPAALVKMIDADVDRWVAAIK